jgi:hypothetical protein
LPTSQSRKHRGYATQRIAADYVRDVFPYVEPTGAGRQGRDLLSTPGVWFECKARRGFSPLAALKQAKADAGSDLPVGILRMDGQGEKSVSEWVAVLRFEDLKRLLKEAGYGPEDNE